MKTQQKYSTKYWVGHNINKDDIIVNTLFKSRHDTEQAMTEIIGEEWYDWPEYQIILVEILEVLK